MNTLTIIQARTSSSRLPGKALLPVAGYPSAVLAALRAANRGHKIVLATSNDSSDDELAEQARKHGLVVFRGPLHDVLARYYLASSNLPDHSAVIRLTADNVVPDGEFVGELAKAFVSSGKDYVYADSISSGLPYGLGAEVFSVAALRRAHREATLASDREHVAPWIQRNCTSLAYRPQYVVDRDFGYLRCTIDDDEDYERILRLFSDVRDPLRISWQELLERLRKLPGEPTFRVPYRILGGKPQSRLTLGTAQLGMEYGLVNDHGKPTVQEAKTIVQTAIAHGVTTIDTARSYGSAEAVLGQAVSGAWASRVEVITKLDLFELPGDASITQVRARVDESVARSCEALRVSQLAILLLHRWQDHDLWRGAAWERLLELRETGKIGSLGASVYQPNEGLEALRDPDVGHLQVPMNVLDWRWEAEGFDRAVAHRTDVVVHARSALLQGILVHPASRWPAVEDFDAFQCAQGLRQLADQFGRESVTDLCLAYVRSLPWVNSVVVGCETMSQLQENLRLFRTADLSAAQCQQVREELPRAPENLLNPSKWKIVHEESAAG